jgi:hypothetical protein
MRVVKPEALTPSPSIVGVTLGGLVATVGVLALLYALPVAGIDTIDVPHTLGGALTSHVRAAFAAGTAIFFIAGILVWPSAMLVAWAILPGANVGFTGAAMKGTVTGVAVWIVSSVTLGIAASLGRANNPYAPGAFALNLGAAAAVSLFVACVLYGVAIALVAAMEAGVATSELLGWSDYYHAAGAPRVLGEHRSSTDDLLDKLGRGA